MMFKNSIKGACNHVCIKKCGEKFTAKQKPKSTHWDYYDCDDDSNCGVCYCPNSDR